MEIIGFGGTIESTEGYVQLALRVGPIVALTRFHVINLEVFRSEERRVGKEC